MSASLNTILVLFPRVTILTKTLGNLLGACTTFLLLFTKINSLLNATRHPTPSSPPPHTHLLFSLISFTQKENQAGKEWPAKTPISKRCHHPTLGRFFSYPVFMDYSYIIATREWIIIEPVVSIILFHISFGHNYL